MNLLLLLSLGRLCFQGNTDDCLLVFSRILLKKKILFLKLTFSGQCKRDRFTVRPSVGINVPTLCGINTGQHSKYIQQDLQQRE